MLLCQSVRTCYQINLISFNCLCSFGLLLAGGSVFGCIFFFSFFFFGFCMIGGGQTRNGRVFRCRPFSHTPRMKSRMSCITFSRLQSFSQFSVGVYHLVFMSSFFFLPPIMGLDKLLRPLCGGFNGLLRWQTHVGDGKTCWAFTRTSSDCVWGLNQWKSLFYLC